MKMFFLLSVGLNAWVSPRSCWLGETPRPHTLISPSHGSPIPPFPFPPSRALCCTQRGRLPAKLQEHFCKYLPQTKLFLRPKTKALMSLYSTRTPIQPPKKTVEQAGNLCLRGAAGEKRPGTDQAVFSSLFGAYF